MNRFSRRTVVVAVVILGAVWSAAIPGRSFGQGESDAAAVHFLWAFGALVGPQGNHKLIAVDRDLPLQTGDRLQFMVSHQAPCFIYLFHLNGGNALTLLYPRQFAPTPAKTDAAIYVPSGNQWFALDEETGPEKFFLLASHQPLLKIENLYLHLRTLTGENDRQATIAAIIDAIKELRRRHLRNTGPVERPIRLGGSFRGMDEDLAAKVPDLSTIAVEIMASNFYSRTFTIDHR